MQCAPTPHPSLADRLTGEGAAVDSQAPYGYGSTMGTARWDLGDEQVDAAIDVGSACRGHPLGQEMRRVG
jgi:hypothetical protein